MNRILEWLTQHFHDADDVGTALALAAFIFGGIGSYLEIKRFVGLGLACFGAAAVAWGVNAIQTRELRILQHGIRVAERIQETLARAWGILFIGGGVVLMGYGILTALNPRAPIPHSLQSFSEAPPGSGVLLLVGGIVGLLYALTMLFAAGARGSGGFVRLIMSLPGRFLGLALAFIFSIVIALALLQIFAPGAWTALWQTFWQRLGDLVGG